MFALSQSTVAENPGDENPGTDGTFSGFLPLDGLRGKSGKTL
jgi:hypothetical protein